MTRGELTANSKGLRLGNFVQIRDVINEELESIWAGNKTAEEGLTDASERANKLIKKFCGGISNAKRANCCIKTKFYLTFYLLLR